MELCPGGRTITFFFFLRLPGEPESSGKAAVYLRGFLGFYLLQIGSWLDSQEKDVGEGRGARGGGGGRSGLLCIWRGGGDDSEGPRRVERPLSVFAGRCVLMPEFQMSSL